MVARHGLTEVYAPPEGTATTALYVAGGSHRQRVLLSSDPLEYIMTDHRYLIYI